MKLIKKIHFMVLEVIFMHLGVITSFLLSKDKASEEELNDLCTFENLETSIRLHIEFTLNNNLNSSELNDLQSLLKKFEDVFNRLFPYSANNTFSLPYSDRNTWILTTALLAKKRFSELRRELEVLKMELVN